MSKTVKKLLLNLDRAKFSRVRIILMGKLLIFAFSRDKKNDSQDVTYPSYGDGKGSHCCV